jgi:hypothetical protein
MKLWGDIGNASLSVIFPEPRDRVLIACQIQSGGTWTDRTYEVVRSGSGWQLDFGDGGCEKLSSWNAVLDWLISLRPRDVELLEAP